MSESLQPSRKLPPSERDFEIYEAVHIQHQSTWLLADRHHLSQTRVRQIIRRVVEWLGEVLPPQAKVAKEQELYLARQIAADRFQHQLEEITGLWEETRESKYAGIRIRLTTAQARLGVVGGVAAGLAADAIEGIEVPTYQPPPEPVGRAVPATQALIASGGPASDPRYAAIPDIEIAETYPPDPVPFREITEEVVATREAAGDPFPFKVIRALYEHGYLPSRKPVPESQFPTPAPNQQSSDPPVRDFSDTDHNAADDVATTAPRSAETNDAPSTCD